MDESTLDPRIVRSRAVIMTAASEHFLRKGYVGANVDEIAAEARVSKRTVYNIFGTKEQLFREILAEAFGTAERFSRETVSVLTDTDDLAGELKAVAVRLARIVLDPRVVRLRRLLIGEAERFPELAGEYYRRAPDRVMDTLAEAIGRLGERGLLRASDPRLAAEHFAFLVMGAALDRALFTVDGETLPQTEIETRAVAGVAAFLAAYKDENS
ncbi:TetR/AcrR family transcriptional regulator [Stackebrandtia nassauensis]|uniref:Transcriptional regulator, TetR family n=1 Tax=Stackebrandtia nassauensis (strain DSM 44728 / CIP 108903 / NRRL B-16338 / NBRC 102104 / LLR-40K-21) TaxID=446470 RepID=D3QAR7_STANL|nr:TetR/AcrR family transcriptional regulator [Stackebrandtia nassauensis]ADD44713.1 transcriptional regulator, TetR family [Stackebrandtia nassauensis DSM 44728]